MSDIDETTKHLTRLARFFLKAGWDVEGTIGEVPVVACHPEYVACHPEYNVEINLTALAQALGEAER